MLCGKLNLLDGPVDSPIEFNVGDLSIAFFQRYHKWQAEYVKVVVAVRCSDVKCREEVVVVLQHVVVAAENHKIMNSNAICS